MAPRYFYYLVFINAMLNVIQYVPSVLIDARFDGAIIACLLSVLISTLLMYQVVKRLGEFPGQGLPELMKRYMPKAVSASIIVICTGLWYTAGLCTLLGFTMLTVEYIDPSLSETVVMVTFLLVVLAVARMSSDSVMYGTEMLFVVNLPLVFFILFKTLTGDGIRWDTMLDVLTHAHSWPPYTTFAATTFILSGYINMVVFNRVFSIPIKTKWLPWIIVPTCMGVVLTTFLIPFLYHGTVTIDRYLFPWIMTADAIRMDFFLVERLMFIFLLVYVSISLISISIHWHVGLEFAKSLLPFREGSKLSSYSIGAVLVLFGAIALCLVPLNSLQIEDFNIAFQLVRLPGECFILLVIIYLQKKRRSL
ncbi:hypothetical protein RAC89_18275 [Paenibacillus sp. GD4]|jgi:hypothetical protein|uniref:hypothetical protein n=1 Tax=Paenibacillus sp. GD4 TaxID=3068890 RepID=UPI002796B6E9|nr:hypothetical protein [Paenibacillus sp. GD4]MDQ1912339.1 hypothetical protein [Paenibacillus sp. GD4]